MEVRRVSTAGTFRLLAWQPFLSQALILGAVTHSPRASVWICVALTPSAAVKSNVSSVLTSGKRASRSRWRITDSCRDACSAVSTSWR
jgi:hypothetical protein